MNQLSETQKAYLAGLIDGEGCVTISKYQGKANRSPVYRAFLIIDMTNKEVIEMVKGMTGAGTIYYEDKNSKNKSHCSAYRWCITNIAELVFVLRAILPYLVCKRGEAETLLEFLSLPADPSMGKGYSKPAFYSARRDTYYQRLRDLKTFGKGITEDRPMPHVEPVYNPQLSFL